MQTVAAISFHDDHSMSMDMEGVVRIDITAPRQVDADTWFSELLIRTSGGTVVMNLTANDPANLEVVAQGLE